MPCSARRVSPRVIWSRTRFLVVFRRTRLKRSAKPPVSEMKRRAMENVRKSAPNCLQTSNCFAAARAFSFRKLRCLIPSTRSMNSFHLILAMFEFVVLLFSLSLHEAAHAWMASRLGDPTARMMGRVTLNPIKHIDLIGTIIIPLFMLLMPGYGQFLIGWAKPTPVTPKNFKNITRDDILTTVAGPCSNLLAAIVATIALLILSKSSAQGSAIVHELAGAGSVDPALASSALLPL